MSKIVFFNIPARGHVNPTLAVVRELVERGNAVWYYSYEPFREKIAATGATFVSCDAFDLERRLSPKDSLRLSKDLAFSTKILVETALALVPWLEAELRQIEPDCVVSDSTAIWGKIIAQKLDVPFVASSAVFAFNRHSAKIMKSSFRETLKTLLALPKISRQLKRLRKIGYSPSGVLELVALDPKRDAIVYTTPEFQPFSETFPKNFAFVGPSIRPATSEFRKSRDVLVYVSTGTVVDNTAAFYRNCVAAFAQNPKIQVVMSVGAIGGADVLGPLPENITALSDVDQIAVLREADVFISHCGMNGANESLYFGTPIVAVPQTAEQRGVANRVLELGAGVLLPDYSEKSIANAVETLLSIPTYRENAEKIAAVFSRSPGAKGAADKILAACKK